MNHRTKLTLALVAVLGLTGVTRTQAQSAREEEKRREQLLAELMGTIAEQQNWPVKIFDVKHANVDHLWKLLTGVFRGEIKADSIQRVLIVRAPKEIMPAIEDTIKRFDVPPPPPPPPGISKNIELTAYLVVASEQAEPSATVPSDLQGVVKQLKNVFPYQGFRVLDTLVLRAREGTRGEMSGVAPSSKTEGAPAPAPTIYQLKFDSTRIASDEKGRVIWINGLRLGSRIPLYTSEKSFNYHDIGISADVDVREGQKVVVGKSGIGGPDRTMFLVLTAKVAD